MGASIVAAMLGAAASLGAAGCCAAQIAHDPRHAASNRGIIRLSMGFASAWFVGNPFAKRIIGTMLKDG
jgi:hypothetical protein